jgi:Ser/Thr protein kinase RdoA (MazF antagonist)
LLKSMDRDRAAAVFTPAARHALDAFPIDPQALELVSISENITFRVEDAQDGATYVLRLHRPGYHSLDELVSERRWIRALSDAGIAVPTPLAAHDGRDYVVATVPTTGEQRYAGVSRWCEGQLLADVLEQTDNGVLVEGYFVQLGTIAAAMHNQASGWRAPSGFVRHALDADGLLGEAPFWGRFWEHPGLSLTERTLLLDTRSRIRSSLEQFGRAASTFSMIHADLHPGNVLVDDERLTVIDFDDAGFGWHQYDAAVALFHSQTRADFTTIEQAFLRGYQASRNISNDALALLPMFILIRGMAVIGWISQRPELDTSEYFEWLKDTVCAQCATFRSPC